MDKNPNKQQLRNRISELELLLEQEVDTNTVLEITEEILELRKLLSEKKEG